nr:hypothetical protein CPGR_00816 [Mycolicibacterium fortuitum subsp. fortuitum DSM 46621 = ATCC 6841 = JCM 6387]CRL80076.1 hypothetical protein CPGR_03272 [Mycolicibacter nonchromogenicus]
MHPKAVRRMQDDPPVTELVPETFHHEGAVAGYDAGGLALIVQQLVEVVGSEPGETHCLATLVELSATECGKFSGECSDCGTQLGRPAHAVTAPERQPGRLTRGRYDQHPVVGDLGDPPAGGAQGNDVAGARLVDHLLVEFADAGWLFGISGQVDGEQATVGDGSAGGDGQALRAGAGGQGAVVAVVDEARPQLGELGGRVLARQQIQRGFERAARQCGEGRAASHGVEPGVGVDRFQGGDRHRVLGQHVERIGRHMHGLDVARAHALHCHRAADEIGAMLGEQHALGDLTDLVPRTADPLQATGHRRRRLDLDHQIDGSHVDAQFQAGSGDDGAQPAALEVIFDLGPLLLADRAVVCPGQQSRCAVGLPAGHELGRRTSAHLRIVVQRELDAGPFGVDLVEPRGQPLGQPPGVGEHDRGLVCLDQIDDAFLDIGPDAVVVEVGHVLDGDLHREVEGLTGRWSDDGGRSLPRQEPGHLFRWTYRGRQPDPLGGLGEHLVEPFEGKRQVCATLGGGDGMDLVDDHRPNGGERFAGRRGEHQEQGFRRGDQDVGWLGQHRPALVGRGVPGPDADADGRGRDTVTLCHPRDPRQRGAQIAFDIDRQGLEGGHVEHRRA